jgi:two-component system, cell cycle sensor histidine kinase and response regulator CckA
MRKDGRPDSAAPTAAADTQLAVLEAAPNAIVGVDRDGLIVYTNPRVETTFGYTRAELIGAPVERLLPQRVADRHVGHRAGFMRQPGARPMGIGLDLAGRRKDGSEFPVEISLSPVETANGLRVFATVVDITARKALESQLIQAQKMESIGRLAGGIAHDFNNMLSAIGGFADLLAEDLAQPELPQRGVLQQSVQGIQAAADKATALTTQLLAFSRQQAVAPQVLDLRASVAALEPMLRRLIGEHVELVLALDPASGSYRGDPGQLDQILVNLVVNARDAVGDHGRVTIETGNTVFDETYASEHFDVTPGEYVMLAVSDTGSGIDPSAREHIFEPFFTTKERGRGTGLGLATTYGIVRQAGGHIWLYSEPGLGTTFKIYFPRVAAAPARERAVAVHRRGAGSGAVLLVEDEAVVRDFTTRILDRAGFSVIAAGDATEALRVIEDEGRAIDVLVTDVVMPGMSGPDLAARVQVRHPGVGIVLLSGYTAETLNLESVLERGARFLPKPFTAADLIGAVKEVGIGAKREAAGDAPEA